MTIIKVAEAKLSDEPKTITVHLTETEAAIAAVREGKQNA